MADNREIPFFRAVNEAIELEMDHDETVISIGLGHNDPKRIFGTTENLLEKFGPNRALEMPISENAITGICVGLASQGFKPILTHQRVDFALLSMDQIVNSAAKWSFMFALERGVPMVIRMIIGRGWGQGPTHSQSLQAWFAHIPGLKVVMPSSPANAKGLLAASIQDPNPVIFIEHRWLHNVEGMVPKKRYFDNSNGSQILRNGDDFTVVASSLMVTEALKASSHLSSYGIGLEVIDVTSLRPLNIDPIVESVKKTGRLIVLENAQGIGSFSGEIISQIASQSATEMKMNPIRLASRDIPFPTSPCLTDDLYSDANSIIKTICNVMDKEIPLISRHDTPHDVPGDWFKGPF